MLDRRIQLSGAWAMVMLLYLMGDVLRIYSGDFARVFESPQPDELKWFAAAVIMLIPISMVFLSLVLPRSIGRWANIVVAVGFFAFVLVDIGSYPGAYDKFLLAVSLVINVVTVWLAWRWPATGTPLAAKA
ncbi:MAG: hypothetical protein KME04_17485 [Pleurocapsa minor GSE-CHR-MK-17-07R]|jgi:hypothetical protein|nr:hypothetical protein [Pleurocapsa minor GSE-CHR-MK 17-07R]